MRYDLAKENEKQNAILQFKKLLDGKKRIDIKTIHNNRSLNQNAYLHVILSCYGLHFGLTLDEAKHQVKVILGYTYEKNGIQFVKQTRSMDSKELTIFIEKIRKHSSENGCYLPEPGEIKDELLNYIESNKIYL